MTHEAAVVNAREIAGRVRGAIRSPGDLRRVPDAVPVA